MKKEALRRETSRVRREIQVIKGKLTLRKIASLIFMHDHEIAAFTGYSLSYIQHIVIKLLEIFNASTRTDLTFKIEKSWGLDWKEYDKYSNNPNHVKDLEWLLVAGKSTRKELAL